MPEKATGIQTPSSRLGAWTIDEKHDCFCLENVVYTTKAAASDFQKLSIFVPRAYAYVSGKWRGAMERYTAATAPVVFANNASGYMQMPPCRLGGPRDSGLKYLRRGMIYITCGCRGRESRDDGGHLVGKSPATLIDLKTAIRFLRRNSHMLPGDFERMISVGWSAGGAMSALLGVTGEDPRYERYLLENGAYMDESDTVYAAQVYCPIIDLERADAAYEWMFHADKESEASRAGPAETMTPFKNALSKALAGRYVEYVNHLALKDPTSGEKLTLSADGRGGTFYEAFMARLDRSATEFLRRVQDGRYPLGRTLREYLSDKRDWLSRDGERAHISGLDAYVLRHRRRMKPCTAFDSLAMNSGENQLFGSDEQDFMHFSTDVADALEAIKADFPKAHARYREAFAKLSEDSALAERVRLLNPMRYVCQDSKGKRAKHFRIRVGARDADTSFSVSMVFALALANVGGCTVDDALVWDQPHAEADDPDEYLDWIDSVMR